MTKDENARLRLITRRFFASGTSSLSELGDLYEKFPEDREIIRQWVCELRMFADRAQGLANSWEERYPELRARDSSAPPVTRQQLPTTTPSV
jgi:hypothetical protein